MTEYLNTAINPDAPWSFITDTEENILHDLEHYTLDPVFEFYGNFVNQSPEWLSQEVAAKYAGCTSISGNFLYLSHAFRLVTDDTGLISRLSAAIERNKARPEYQDALKKHLADLPTLTKENAYVGRCYAFAGSWFRLTRVYRLTEQEANEKALLYLDHFEGATRHGETIGGAIPGGDTLQSTKGWEI
ncbi:hypothetical protein [Flavonifractor plautii]|uniref:hypothetical protein n=1 Tax=Flavonifractor plautii TaxID=292800 RepID=UPI00189C2508|nr:hypothetical protein [Flavonifractor plautii]DAL42541.1 MAG TPA_asm: hypothetical protein [Caudoviricetes sp.]